MNGRAFARLKRWLFPKESEEWRSAPRQPTPEVVVYYWDGSPPVGHALRDVSETGAYIYTPERWYVGTIIRIVLQRPAGAVQEEGPIAAQASACIAARVIRHGSDGVAVDFAFRTEDEREALGRFLASIVSQPAATLLAPASVNPSERPHRSGQSLIEFALIVPIVFILAVNAVNLTGFIFAWITVAAAARSGAEYMIMSSASPGSPTAATLAQIKTQVTADVASLMNRSSLLVAICTNATTAANGCTTLFDPEAPTYTLATVDVTYTYNPYIPLFSFPGLGISATLPSATVHRKAVMRMLQ
jgi:Flp pilus assembly protein TadG